MNKKLASEIFKRVEIDQRMRKRFIAGKVRWDKTIDKRNTEWLKKVVARYGWPTISMVGKKASHGVWLLAQHADHDLRFQKKVMKLLKEIYKHDKKEIKPVNIAYLTDRILVHEKKSQIFGTQFIRKSGEGRFKSFPIKDKKNVNKRRKSYGLPSLEENTRKINREYKKLEGKKPRGIVNK